MGGGNCLFGTEIDRTTPIFRGNMSVVEVASETSNPTKLPDTEPLQAGKIDASTTRCFDLLCVGKCSEGNNLKLNVQSANKIPELITKNEKGEPVFREPEPMCTIQGPAGHNVWVNIKLETITTKASDYMCLGIKKRGEDEYYGILHAKNSSKYIDVLESDIVELFPLASSTPLSTEYTAVKAGDTAKITGADTYDFGSVYRVEVTLHNSQWIKVPCDLNKLNSNGRWENNGHIGIGQVNGKRQLLAVNVISTQLSSSIDGMHWSNVANITDLSGFTWAAGMAYGNGIWCAVDFSSGEVRYSIDEAKSWRVSQVKFSDRVYALVFGEDKFVAVSNAGVVYVSADADSWREVANLNMNTVRVLGYGDNNWVCAGFTGSVYSSADGIKWTSIGSNLGSVGKRPHGGVFSNGYFYAIDDHHSETNNIIKSSKGEVWTKVFSLSCNEHVNVTYFNNKLYLISISGDHCHIGLFRPDGTIDEI